MLLDLDQPIQAFQLVREARVEAGHKVAPRLVSWLWAAEAETAATAGDHRGCRQALDHAQATLPAGAARDPELPYLSLDEHHLTRWRGSALARLGDQAAVDQLSAALECVDSESTRARGSLHIDLAQALVLAGGRDAADEHVQFARRLAGQTGSVRQQRRLAALAA